MSDPRRVLDDWLKANAWDPIHVGGDIMDEAVENLHRLFLTSEEARRLSVAEVASAVNSYIDIKKTQIIDGQMGPMLLYVWHDAMAGAVVRRLRFAVPQTRDALRLPDRSECLH